MVRSQHGRGVAVLECDEQQLHDRGLEEALWLWGRDLVENRPAAVGRVGATEAGISERQGVVIVTPAGALPDPLPERLAERLETLVGSRPLLIDLSDVMVVSAAPVVALVGWALGGGSEECCVVCSRATARVLLRKWHVCRCLAVFASVGDALQARRFARDGYGTGWQPTYQANGTAPSTSPVR